MDSQRKDPDPNGDLILSIGVEEMPVRVSSKTLSLASPVLAAMLKPNFAEGQVLSNTKTNEVATIRLPDDDPEAMLWLCKAFHLKQTHSEVSFPLLEKLAILCDKYDMSLALASWSEVWFSTIEAFTPSGCRYPKML